MTIIDIKTAYQWIKEDSFLTDCTKILVEQLKQKSGSDFRQFVSFLEGVSQGLSAQEHLEAAEAFLECGYILFDQQGNREEAIRYFRRAIDKYIPATHYIAMVKWMIGWLQWQNSAERAKSIVTLRSSIDDIEHLSKQPVHGRKSANWYQARHKEMRETLDWLLTSQTGTASTPPGNQAGFSGPPHSSSSTGSAGPTSTAGAAGPSYQSATPPPAPGASTTSNLPDEKDKLRMYGVAAKVPAGGWGALGFDIKKAISYLEVSRVWIDDRLHIVKNLRSKGHSINLLAYDQKYVVCNVTGNSMNKAGIDKGDYVLLNQQDNADDGDIVVAELVNKDGDDGSHMTLKRLMHRGRNLILVPESDHDEYQEIEIKPDSNETFFIRGVAYAVFKPIKE